jgi:hypothetical protein
MSEPQIKEKRTRTCKKSYVMQEQAALNDAASAVEKKLDISQLKLISRRLETLAPLAAEERVANKEKERTDAEQQARQHEERQSRIQELEAENTRLKNQGDAHVCPVRREIVPDPKHAERITALEKHRDSLQAQVAFLLRHVAQKDTLALLAVRELDRAIAEPVCEGVGWHFMEVASFNLSYKSFSQWNDIVCRASSNGSLVKLCRAAIALDISTRTSDPVTQAKMLTGTIRTVE